MGWRRDGEQRAGGEVSHDDGAPARGGGGNWVGKLHWEEVKLVECLIWGKKWQDGHSTCADERRGRW